MTMITTWLETHLARVREDFNYINMELDLSIPYTERKRQEMEENAAYLAYVMDWLEIYLEQERQKHEHDWQAECEEWRRGVGAFVEWMQLRIGDIPAQGNAHELINKLADQHIMEFVCHKFLALCPQAIINWNPPPLTPEELERARKLAQEYEDDHD